METEQLQQRQDEAPLRIGSEDPLIGQRAPGASNKRAFAVAGFTVLACLLIAGQALTAYFVLNQKSQINNLENKAESLRKQLRSRPQAPSSAGRMMQMGNMPLLMELPMENEKKAVPLTKLQDTAMVSLEKHVTNLLQTEVPQFNKSFQTNLQDLKQQMDENDWKSFETWMRHWLLFNMAQQKPPTPPTPTAALVQTKCTVEASIVVNPGTFKPSCDEKGDYLPLQCWHSTGFCWCVDKNGSVVKDTIIRGRPDCSNPQGRTRLMAYHSMIPRLLETKAAPEE